MKLSKAMQIKQVQRDQVMTNEEIAKALDMTPCQVRYLIASGMQKLRLKAMARNLRFEDYFE